jgi:hypothetical protein
MAIPHDLNFKMYLPATGELEVQHKKTNPVNGATFNSNDTHCEFRIGGNQANRFVDGNSLYILATFATGVANTSLTKYGVLSALSRVVVESTGGTQICDINNYHALKRIKVVENADIDYVGNDGVMLHGTSGADTNVTINTAKTFLIPLDNLGLDQYIPILSEGLVFKCYWATAFDYCYEITTANLTATSMSITSVSLNYDVIELSSAAMNQMIQDTGGKFIMQNNAYIRTGTTLADATGLDLSITAGRSKVKKLYACLRPNASDAHAADRADRLNMSIETLTSSYLEIDGTKVNDKTLTFAPDDVAEVVMAIRKARNIPVHVLGQTMRNADEFGAVTDPQTPANRPNIFYWVFDLTDGTDTRLSKSGLNIKGNSNVNLNVKASAGASGVLDIFVEYENTLVLDMSPGGDRTFQVFN